MTQENPSEEKRTLPNRRRFNLGVMVVSALIGLAGTLPGLAQASPYWAAQDEVFCQITDGLTVSLSPYQVKLLALH